MRRDPRYPQYQPTIQRREPDKRTNPRFGRKSVAGGTGGGGVVVPQQYIRVGGGHELRVMPRVIGIKTSNDPVPDFLPDGLEPNINSEGSFPDAFGYGYLDGIAQVFVYAPDAVHVFNALLGDPVGWTYPVLEVLQIPDQTRFNDPEEELGTVYTVYQVGVL